MPARVVRRYASIALVACSAVVTGASALAAPAGSLPARPPVQLTGKQLAALLVLASALPRGYQLARNGSHNSGNRLETATPKYDLARMSCSAIYQDYGRAGFGESAFAEDVYMSLSGLRGTGLLQQVYQFRDAKGAASFWRGLRAIIIRCPLFGAASGINPGKIVQHVFAVRYQGGHAFGADATDTQPVFGRVNLAMLVIVAGDDVFTAGALGFSRPVPADPSARALMNGLIARVQAGRLCHAGHYPGHGNLA